MGQLMTFTLVRVSGSRPGPFTHCSTKTGCVGLNGIVFMPPSVRQKIPSARRLRELAVGMEEYSRRGSNQRMRPKRARKPTISNRWFSGNFRLALTRGLRRTTKRRLDGDICGGARLIFDDERLIEPIRQPAAHDSHDRIGPTARDKSYEPVHRSRRICLRPCNPRCGRQRGSTRCQMQKFTAWKFHRVPLTTRDSATRRSRTDQCQIDFRDARRPMAPLLSLPSETSARPTGSSIITLPR
jgi:hypothetical protein